MVHVHGGIDPVLPLVVIEAELAVLVTIGKLLIIFRSQYMPVNARSLKLLVYMGKAPQHRLHTARGRSFAALPKKVLQFFVVGRINFPERKANALKRGQVLLNRIAGCIRLGSYRHDAAPIAVHP